MLSPSRSLVRGLFAAALLCFVGAAGAALPAGVTAGASVEGISEYALANGLKVLLFPDASQPKVTVNVTYLVGSRMENYGETGMAHLLEHMVFKGTTTRGNLMTALAQRGMAFNGSTWYDRTNYFETFPASDEGLDWALGMEADRMVNSTVLRKDLDSEMTVVRNEMERNENSSVRILIQRTTAAGFDWHNYGKDTIGARTDVERVDIGRLQAFYRLYYQPDNAVLTIAGAFDPDRALAAVAKYFGPIPKPARVLPSLHTDEPVQDGSREVTLRRVGNTQWLSAMYHTVPGAHPDAIAISAAVDAMTVSPGGRLYKALVETRKAAAVDDFVYTGFDPGFAMFLAQVPENESLDAARTTMLQVIEDVAKQPFSAAEIDRVRAKALKSIDDTINDPQRLGIALSSSIATGDWRLFFLQRDRWRALTPADVDRVAGAYFKASNRTVGEFIPDAKPDRAPAPPAVNIAAMVKDYKGDPAVAAGENFDATPANLDARAQRYTLANGMKVALLPKKTRGGTVHFSLSMHYGDEASIKGREGEAKLTGSMLLRGTSKHSRQEIDDTLDRLRASLSISGGQTGLSARGQTVGANLAPTLDLLAEALQHPSFPAAELETLKRAQTAGIEQGRTDPRAVAVRALARYDNPYPKGDDRYTPTFDEELAEIKAPGVDRLQDFHRSFYGASAAEISVVGDFDVAAVKDQLQRLFGAWSAPNRYMRVPDPLVTKRATAMPIETPDKANAFLIGQTAFALSDKDPDYPALMLANYMLGGSTNARLWNRVRQKEGLSYGINSSMQASSWEPNTTISISATFAPENVERLRRAVQDEVERVQREGFTAEEVADGKRALLQQRRLSRSQDATLAAALNEQSFVGRTFDYSAKLDAALDSLDAPTVNAALRKYLKPDAFASVFAGDFAKVKKQ
ncbi:MAG TPA: pitrilysin family protein [Casimicrobiaceae bacterium]|nr:pitrilysin family protein [Casimicrobiaceae bacterium]